jgi:hypothetical protein
MFIKSALSALCLVAFVSLVSVEAIAQVSEAQTIRLEQCRNGGTVDVSNDCNTTSAFVTGNVGSQNSHWSESQFVPYRAIITDLAAGTHTVLIGYDAMESGKHALDYLGSYNYTEVNANPCINGDCPAGGFVTAAIPADPYIVGGSGYIAKTNPNTLGPIQVIPGDMTLWGGTGAVINSVLYEGTFLGTKATEERRVRVTFTLASAQTSVVLAWGGHIGWQGDWGAGQSAGGLSGSPYHMRVLELTLPSGAKQNIGNQDRSLSADAVDIAGQIIIVKEVVTSDGSDSDPQDFTFTAGSNFDPLQFLLEDDNDSTDELSDRKTSLPVFAFGGAGINVSEGAVMGFRVLDIVCRDQTGALDTNSNATVSLAASPGDPSSVNVIVDATGIGTTSEFVQIVTCTFTNGKLTASAAPVKVAGRVVDKNERGVSGVTVTVQDLTTGQEHSVKTDKFGRYKFPTIIIEEFYIVRANKNGLKLVNPSFQFDLGDDTSDVVFRGR